MLSWAVDEPEYILALLLEGQTTLRPYSNPIDHYRQHQITQCAHAQEVCTAEAKFGSPTTITKFNLISQCPSVTMAFHKYMAFMITSCIHGRMIILKAKAGL